MTVKFWLFVVLCLSAIVGALAAGLTIGWNSTDPASECYYEIYLVSIIDTLGEKRTVGGVKYVSERDGYLTLCDTLGNWFIIPIRDKVDYIKYTVTDSVRCEGMKR